jgi:hypothetical protein
VHVLVDKQLVLLLQVVQEEGVINIKHLKVQEQLIKVLLVQKLLVMAVEVVVEVLHKLQQQILLMMVVLVEMV